MESLPQEIIDEIIDNLPRSGLRSSSLVAKRWKKRSQQRAFSSILFYSEYTVNSWHIHTQSDPGGVPSYAQCARFSEITDWRDPELLGRVLRNFNSLTTLRVSDTLLPDGMLEQISREQFSKKITTLHLGSPWCSPSTLMSMTIVFPNLQNLLIRKHRIRTGRLLSDYPVLPQSRPLDSLEVVRCVPGVAETLANLRLTSRRLTLDVKIENIQNLLSVSSETVEELELIGVCSLCVNCKYINDDFVDFPDRSSSCPIDLPPFPALASLKIRVCGDAPSVHLVNILSFISSVPVLVSIFLECWAPLRSEPGPSNTWDRLDEWLVQMDKALLLRVAWCWSSYHGGKLNHWGSFYPSSKRLAKSSMTRPGYSSSRIRRYCRSKILEVSYMILTSFWL